MIVMKKQGWRSFSMIIVTALLLCSCATVPLTGRRQLDLIPAPVMLSMSFQQYDEFLKTNQVSSDQAQAQMVKSVGKRIQAAVEEYMAVNNISERLKGYQWEFNLFESPAMNAWCMPGGKVAVYTGLLPLTQDEAGLAVVIGHEVAHAVARHGDERMSQGLLTQLGGLSLSLALKEHPQATQELWMRVFGAGAQLGVLLPYSRLHEREADRLGLIFMAMAGYDPGAAVSFWERMSAAKQGARPPEFLSTHPSDRQRIEDIKKHLTEARGYYKK